MVNVNPLYKPRELEFQLTDSGAEAIIVLENFAAVLQEALPSTPVKHVVVASLGDMLGRVKGMLVNAVVRHVKKMVPAYAIPAATMFNDALADGRKSGFTPAAIGQQEYRLPAIHRRHHRRRQGRDADASQSRRQHAAGRSVEPADGRCRRRGPTI